MYFWNVSLTLFRFLNMPLHIGHYVLHHTNLCESKPVLAPFISDHKMWNSLPSHVNTAPSLSTFCSRLKSHLFSLSYPYVSLFSCLVPMQWLATSDTIITFAFTFLHFTRSMSCHSCGVFSRLVCCRRQPCCDCSRVTVSSTAACWCPFSLGLATMRTSSAATPPRRCVWWTKLERLAQWWYPFPRYVVIYLPDMFEDKDSGTKPAVDPWKSKVIPVIVIVVN